MNREFILAGDPSEATACARAWGWDPLGTTGDWRKQDGTTIRRLMANRKVVEQELDCVSHIKKPIIHLCPGYRRNPELPSILEAITDAGGICVGPWKTKDRRQ